jgi:hypothetical protein
VEEAATKHGWHLLLFGGTLRDLCVTWSAAPRDLDFVVPGASVEELRAAFANHIERQTRFGGLRLRIGALPVDIWPLEKTWAFAQALVPGRDPEDLTRTTFLSVEAIVVEVQTRPGRPRQFYSGGFFESFASSVLEINLRENPYPALCVVRTLRTARKLGFSIGPQLATYLVDYCARLPMEKLEEAQLSHYGRVCFSRDTIWTDIKAIKQQKAEGRTIVRLPQPIQRKLPCAASRGENLEFPFRNIKGTRSRPIDR